MDWKWNWVILTKKKNIVLGICILLCVVKVKVVKCSVKEDKVSQEHLNFHLLYWTLLAQAVEQAKCLENQIMPNLDSKVLIMKPAGCRSNAYDCEECIKETENLNSSSLTQVRILKPEEFFTEFDPPKPIFHCTSHKKNGDYLLTSHFRMEYSHHEPNLRDLIPRVFVVEKEVDGIWEYVSIQQHWMIALSTKDGSKYRIRVTAVTPKHVYYPQLSESITMHDIISLISPGQKMIPAPKNIRILDISVSSRYARNNPTVTLRWESGSGLNASCDFDFYYMDDEQLVTVIDSADKAFWADLNVNLGRNYSIRIIERFGHHQQSTPATFHLTVPSCLELYDYKFDSCAPPIPRNIRVENETEISFWVLWDPPIHQNLTNQIESYELSVDRITLASNEIGLFKEHRQIFHGIINGNETRKEIHNATVKGKIRITITANSRGGISPEAWKIYQIKGNLVLARSLEKIWFVFIILFILIITVLMICYWKNYRDKLDREKEKKEIKEGRDKWDKDREEFPPQQVDKYLSKWEIEYASLIIGDVIGQGQFGQVRKAIMNRNGSKTTVAVKTLRGYRIDSNGSTESEKFWEEFEIHKGLDPHLHVVGLVGIVKEHVHALVVEYCDGGDLQTHLRKALQSRASKRKCSPGSSMMGSTAQLSNANEVRVQLSMVTNEAYFLLNNDTERPLTNLDLLTYARQISCGMQFLARNHIVHRDLATRNVLISGSSRILKIADFGLSRDVYLQNLYQQKSNGKPLPLKWMPIESIFSHVFTTKSDVWSFGIVLWELVTLGGAPYHNIDNTQLFDLLKAGYRMPKPEFCPDNLYDLMMSCWEENPIYRPDFESLRLTLDKMIETSNYVTYLNLDTCAVQSLDE